LLHNSHSLFARLGIETLTGGGSWFTQSIRSGAFSPTAFGQVEQDQRRACINWLLNCDEQRDTPLLHLIDNLAFEAGLRGAKLLLASLEQDSVLFPAFRRAGFNVCGWERYWRIKSPHALNGRASNLQWEKPFSKDAHEIDRFRSKHLPPANRAISPQAGQDLPDYILKIDHNIAAIAVSKTFGSKAILYPLLSGLCADPTSALLSLSSALPEFITTCYLGQAAGCGCSDDTLLEISEPASPRKERLVKYFTIMEKVPLGVLNHSKESSHPDPVAPYVHSSKL